MTLPNCQSADQHDIDRAATNSKKTMRYEVRKLDSKSAFKPGHKHLCSMLENYVEPLAIQYVAPAVAGDPESAEHLSRAVGISKRGMIALYFWQARVPVPAFAALLRSVWEHDHRELITAARTRHRLKVMFRYAQFELPVDLPDSIQVWRGTPDLDILKASSGLSWTTDRDLACWFAMRHRGTYGQPLVLSATVTRDEIYMFNDETAEKEVVLFDVRGAIVDGNPLEWNERYVATEARIRASKMPPVKSTKALSAMTPSVAIAA